MGPALLGCLVLLVVLIAIRRRNAADERDAPDAEEQNALDRGLSLLIKDISRDKAAPITPMAPALLPRPATPPRAARGTTPSDTVQVSRRLDALPAAASGFAPDDDAPTTLAVIPNRNGRLPGDVNGTSRS